MSVVELLQKCVLIILYIRVYPGPRYWNIFTRNKKMLFLEISPDMWWVCRRGLRKSRTAIVIEVSSFSYMYQHQNRSTSLFVPLTNETMCTRVYDFVILYRSHRGSMEQDWRMNGPSSNWELRGAECFQGGSQTKLLSLGVCVCTDTSRFMLHLFSSLIIMLSPAFHTIIYISLYAQAHVM